MKGVGQQVGADCNVRGANRDAPGEEGKKGSRVSWHCERQAGDIEEIFEAVV